MPEKGSVILVGAGPGDPGLLTLAGKAALESADVILYDRLVGREILAIMPPSAQTIDVGKNKGRHPVPQDEINRLIIHHALTGKTVVRLKGGDPYLFGRGAEELEGVRRAGIPFRVIPGVTSAIAAPACAGIPVTHREYSSSLHILTGHGKGGASPNIPYRELARLGGTLVFLMSVSAVEEICGNLVNSGLPPDTPAALVENGTRANQRRLSATLATLPANAVEQAVSSPSVLVVGDVVRLGGTLDWLSSLPLHGKRILAVSSQKTGSRLAELLRAHGSAVDEYAGIETVRLPAPDSFWKTLGQYNWIVLSSQFGVDCFFTGLLEAGLDVRSVSQARFAAVGSQTGLALRRRGILPDFIPDEFNGLALGEGLARLAGPQDAILLFRAESGVADLPAALQKSGARIVDIPAYRTLEKSPDPAVLEALQSGAYDALTFTSASAATSFAKAIPQGATLPDVFCIGKTTAKAAEALGLPVTISKEATLESMATAILEKLGQS